MYRRSRYSRNGSNGKIEIIGPKACLGISLGFDFDDRSYYDVFGISSRHTSNGQGITYQ